MYAVEAGALNTLVFLGRYDDAGDQVVAFQHGFDVWRQVVGAQGIRAEPGRAPVIGLTRPEGGGLRESPDSPAPPGLHSRGA